MSRPREWRKASRAKAEVVIVQAATPSTLCPMTGRICWHPGCSAMWCIDDAYADRPEPEDMETTDAHE